MRKGFLRVRLHEVVGVGRELSTATVKVKAAEALLYWSGSNEDFYLPVADRLDILIFENESDALTGYFQLPLKKLYDYPLKKHLITVSCVSRDAVGQHLSSEVFGVVKMQVSYLKDQVGVFEIIVDKVFGKWEGELYVQCHVGDVNSQTTVRKGKEGCFQWSQILPFTLEAIPDKIELLLKDKDIVKDQILGRVTLNPQLQRLFVVQSDKQERSFELSGGGKILLAVTFRLL